MSAKPRCACDSMRPGISVAPAPSITVAPAASGVSDPGMTAAMRFASTRTAPRNGSRPVPSKMLALAIT